MAERTSLPEYVIAFSHRATEGARAHCDRKDYETFYSVVTDLEKDKFKNKIRIKVVDWEEETSTLGDLDNAARKSNALLFLIEGKPGEKQLNGYNDYKTLESKPSLLILDKQLPHWSEQDIKSHEEELNKCFQHKYIPFLDFDQLYSLLSRKLDDLIKKWANSNGISLDDSNSLDDNSTNPQKKKWWLWPLVGAVIIGLSLLLLFLGDRTPRDIPGGQLSGDTTVVTPGDSTSLPGPDPSPVDSTPSKPGLPKPPGTGGGGVSEGKNPEPIPPPPPVKAFDDNAIVIVSDNNDSDIVSSVRSQLLNAHLGLTFQSGGNPQWRVILRETVRDTSKTEYQGMVWYDPTVSLYATIFNSDKIVSEPHTEKHARVYDSKEEAINAARIKALEDLIPKIIEYFNR